jgi:hypothetical protein
MHAGRFNLPKNRGVSHEDMTRLPPSIITKNIFISKQPSLSAGTTLTLNLPCFQGKSSVFILLLVLRFLWSH